MRKKEKARYRDPILACTTDECVDVLRRVSKAALMDAYCHALSALLGQLGEPVSVEDMIDDLRPLLALRGDRVPKI